MQGEGKVFESERVSKCALACGYKCVGGRRFCVSAYQEVKKAVIESVNAPERYLLNSQTLLST